MDGPVSVVRHGSWTPSSTRTEAPSRVCGLVHLLVDFVPATVVGGHSARSATRNNQMVTVPFWVFNDGEGCHFRVTGTPKTRKRSLKTYLVGD